jgi:hypothetical protein
LLVIWYIFPCFGKYYREKSGNPAQESLSEKKKWIKIEGAEFVNSRHTRKECKEKREC